MNNISCQDIRKGMTHSLATMYSSDYANELLNLEKAISSNDSAAIKQINNKIQELSKHFEFETWIENFITQKLEGVAVVTHSAKGIHSGIKNCNINYNLQAKPDNYQFVSSATPNILPFDCTNNAARVGSVYAFLNQIVKDDITVSQLIIDNHPEILRALSDDNEMANHYLQCLEKAIFDDFQKPNASQLNKQIFWPNSDGSYLSHSEHNYRLLIPLYPNSLCYLVYEKIQRRYSQENKKARELRKTKDVEHQSYFSFKDLAILKLGGTKPLNVSKLVQSQNGKNYLLPSMPPKFIKSRYPSISIRQETIFNNALQYFCRFGFRLLFDMVVEPKNVVEERNNRKEAISIILTLLLKFARHIQTTLPTGWSRDYSLPMSQKLWLDPNRAELEGEESFKLQYELGKWLVELELDFASWIQNALKEKFKNANKHFSDAEYREWRREFCAVVKASKRNKEGIF